MEEKARVWKGMREESEETAHFTFLKREKELQGCVFVVLSEQNKSALPWACSLEVRSSVIRGSGSFV